MTLSIITPRLLLGAKTAMPAVGPTWNHADQKKISIAKKMTPTVISALHKTYSADATSARHRNNSN